MPETATPPRRRRASRSSANGGSPQPAARLTKVQATWFHFSDADMSGGVYAGTSTDIGEIRVFRTGETELTFQLECGDVFTGEGDKLIAHLQSLMTEPITEEIPAR